MKMSEIRVALKKLEQEQSLSLNASTELIVIAFKRRTKEETWSKGKERERAWRRAESRERGGKEGNGGKL